MSGRPSCGRGIEPCKMQEGRLRRLPLRRGTSMPREHGEQLLSRLDSTLALPPSLPPGCATPVPMFDGRRVQRLCREDGVRFCGSGRLTSGGTSRRNRLKPPLRLPCPTFKWPRVAFHIWPCTAIAPSICVRSPSRRDVIERRACNANA